MKRKLQPRRKPNSCSARRAQARERAPVRPRHGVELVAREREEVAEGVPGQAAHHRFLGVRIHACKQGSSRIARQTTLRARGGMDPREIRRGRRCMPFSEMRAGGRSHAVIGDGARLPYLLLYYTYV